MEQLISLLSLGLWIGIWYAFTRFGVPQWRPIAKHPAGAFVGMIAASVFLQVFSPTPPQGQASAPVAASAPAEVAPPSAQDRFEQARVALEKAYNDAPNEIKKSAVFNQANETTVKLAGQEGFVAKNWHGVVSQISTDQGGAHAFLVIKSGLGYPVTYKTTQMTAFDVGTAIRRGTPMYEKLGALSDGDRVVFTAQFIRDRARGLREVSLTEEGSLSEPEFLVKFQDIKKAD